MNKILRMLFTAGITAVIVINAFLLLSRRTSFWTMLIIILLIPVGFWIAQMIVDGFVALFKRNK